MSEKYLSSIHRSKYHPKNFHNLALKALDLILWRNLNSMPKIQEIGRWYSNYALFNLEILFLNRFIPVNHFVSAATVGGVMQGYDECSAQKNLENKFPTAAIFIGMANGALCCALQSVCGSYMPAFFGSSIVSFALATAISENTMCPIEQHAHNVLENLNQEPGISFSNLLKSPKAFFGLLMANWSEAFKGAVHAIDEMLPIFASSVKFPFEVASQFCMALHNFSNQDKKPAKSCCASVNLEEVNDALKIAKSKLKSSDGVDFEEEVATIKGSHVASLGAAQSTKSCCNSIG